MTKTMPDDAGSAAVEGEVNEFVEGALLERAQAAEAANDAHVARISALESQLADAHAALDTAKKAGKVSRGTSPPRPRKLGPIGDEPLDAAALREAIAAADRVEVGFSDGKMEIAGLAPVIVDGNVWKNHFDRLMLNHAVTLRGPALASATFAVAGYALILDGKMVAYTPRSDVLMIGAGATMNIADDIYF